MVLSEYRVRGIVKPFTDPVTHGAAGYDVPNLLPAGDVRHRSLVLLAGDGIKPLAVYGGGEPFTVLYVDASDAFTIDLYLQRAATLGT